MDRLSRQRLRRERSDPLTLDRSRGPRSRRSWRGSPPSGGEGAERGRPALGGRGERPGGTFVPSLTGPRGLLDEANPPGRTATPPPRPGGPPAFRGRNLNVSAP